MTARRWLLAAASLSAAFGCVQRLADPELLPSDLARHFNPGQFRGFGEPSLWTLAALGRYRTRIRLTAAGIAQLGGSIRIDEHSNGRVTGHVVMIDRSRGRRGLTRTERDFRIARGDFDRLRAQAAEAGLWSSHPQFWRNPDPQVICVGGNELLFERVDAQGHRVAVTNAQCSAPSALLAVAARFFDIAGERQLHRLLE